MGIFIGIVAAIIWLNLGVLAIRCMDQVAGDSELEAISLPLRLVFILLAPIGFLIFERHLFYAKAKLRD